MRVLLQQKGFGESCFTSSALRVKTREVGHNVMGASLKGKALVVTLVTLGAALRLHKLSS